MIQEYAQGIKRSFDYLHKDKENLEDGFETLVSEKALRIIKLHKPKAKTKATDLALKTLGYLLSAAQRQEIEKEESLVIGGTWAVALQDDLLFIAPYLTDTMPKAFKEQCRVAKIPSKIRPYCYSIDTIPTW